MDYLRHNVNACHSVLLDNCYAIAAYKLTADKDLASVDIISIEFIFFAPILYLIERFT